MTRIAGTITKTEGIPGSDEDGKSKNSYIIKILQAIYRWLELNDGQRMYLLAACDVGKTVRHYNQRRVGETLGAMENQPRKRAADDGTDILCYNNSKEVFAASKILRRDKMFENILLKRVRIHNFNESRMEGDFYYDI